MEAFTGIPEVDQEILLTLDDVSLARSCQLNKYFQEICASNNFLKERIRRELGSSYTQKPESLTWKEWYIFWKQANTSLVDTLSLTPLQGYVSIVSGRDKGVLHGTELYQTISLSLRKALEKGDHELVEYLFEKLKKLKDKYDQDYTSINYSLIDYGLIPLSLNKGYPDIADEIHRMFSYDLKRSGQDYTRKVWLNTQLEQKIIGGLGEYNLVDDFYTMIGEKSIPNLTLDLVSGLIKGFHNEEAKKFVPSLDLDENTYETLLNEAVKVSNQDFIEYLDTFIPEEEAELYLSIKDDVLNYYHQTEEYTRKDGVIIPTILNLSFNQALDEYLKERKYDDIEINYALVSFEMLWYIYLNSKNGKYMLSSLVRNSLYHNRYDFITVLDLDDKTIFDETFWKSLADSIWSFKTESKDLLLYILAHLKRNYPDIYNKILKSDYSLADLNYEVYLLLSELKISKDFPDHVISLLDSIYK